MTNTILRYLPKTNLLFILIPIVLLVASFRNLVQLKRFQIAGYAQGTTYYITYFATDSIISKNSIDSILNSIDSSLSLYKPYSLINKFNSSHTGVIADKKLTDVVKKSIEVYEKTCGIFDITVKPLVAAWGFGVKPVSSLPDSLTVKRLMKCVGSKKIYLKTDSLVKHDPCVNIDLNGIAQGYSVDLLAEQLEGKGINNYLVELGGEIRVKGRKQPHGEEFTIGIEGPAKNLLSVSVLQKIVRLKEGAITTSGNYRKYYESGTKKITHLIDARTGYPINNELISVTVWSKDAMTADGYDNALMGMGLSRAIQFVNMQNDMEAYFIFRHRDGSVSDTATAGFYKLLKQ